MFLPPVWSRLQIPIQICKSKKKQITTAENWKFKLADYEGKQAGLDRFISELFISLPEEDQMSSIIDLIVHHSKSTGLTIQTMQPHDREEFDTYTVVPLKLGMKGSFHEAGIFINKLEQDSHLVEIKKIAMKADDKQPSQDIAVAVELTVTLLRYEKTGHEGS